MYPNALLRPARASGQITQPLIGVITDYGVHGVWVRDTTDYYCVAHPETARQLQARGVPDERIVVTGIPLMPDRKSTRLNSSHVAISYAVFCLKKKKRLSNSAADTTQEPEDTPLLPHRDRGRHPSCSAEAEDRAYQVAFDGGPTMSRAELTQPR